MASNIEVKDFRGMPDPTPQEQAQTESLRAADEAARRSAAAARNAHLYKAPPALMPAAKLSSGGTIPLVGLGTW